MVTDHGLVVSYLGLDSEDGLHQFSHEIDLRHLKSHARSMSAANSTPLRTLGVDVGDHSLDRSAFEGPMLAACVASWSSCMAVPPVLRGLRKAR